MLIFFPFDDHHRENSRDLLVLGCHQLGVGSLLSESEDRIVKTVELGDLLVGFILIIICFAVGQSSYLIEVG